jgi:hypothetical protein
MNDFIDNAYGKLGYSDSSKVFDASRIAINNQAATITETDKPKRK